MRRSPGPCPATTSSLTQLDSTQAITIHAPVERIWPWLAQAGYGGRAGFYSYDVLERRFGACNTGRLNPDLPALTTGDTVPFYPGMLMTVAVADPPHTLVLWLATSANKAIDPTGPWPEEHVAWSWAFVLDPVDANTSRLLTRMRVTYQPTARWGPYVHLLLEQVKTLFQIALSVRGSRAGIPLALAAIDALLSSDDYGSSVERTATLHPLWRGRKPG